jgi:hypothetical protein
MFLHGVFCNTKTVPLDIPILTPEVADLLALAGGGTRLMPLVCVGPSHQEAAQRLTSLQPANLFPDARSPQGALAGLWLYFSYFTESHEVAQELHTPEGSFWHGIVHRQEPDDWNSAYWFRRVGKHPIFEPLSQAALDLGYPAKPGAWDPFAFIEFCAEARTEPGGEKERLAREVQRAEWQLLFSYCASPR